MCDYCVLSRPAGRTRSRRALDQTLEFRETRQYGRRIHAHGYSVSHYTNGYEGVREPMPTLGKPTNWWYTEEQNHHFWSLSQVKRTGLRAQHIAIMQPTQTQTRCTSLVVVCEKRNKLNGRVDTTNFNRQRKVKPIHLDCRNIVGFLVDSLVKYPSPYSCFANTQVLKPNQPAAICFSYNRTRAHPWSGICSGAHQNAWLGLGPKIPYTVVSLAHLIITMCVIIVTCVDAEQQDQRLSSTVRWRGRKRKTTEETGLRGK